MANLGLIDFKLGLYIKINVNTGQFKVHISKLSAKMAINWHKIGQMPLLSKNILFYFLFYFYFLFWARI